MLALSAGVKTPESLCNTYINALVVTRFEMQILIILFAPPITSVQGVFVFEKHRTGHVSRLCIMTNHDQKYLARQQLVNAGEKFASQISMLATYLVGILVKHIKLVPDFCGQLLPCQPLKPEALASNITALLFQSLSFSRAAPDQKVIKCLIGVVVPMKLARFATNQRRLIHQHRNCLIRKQ